MTSGGPRTPRWRRPERCFAFVALLRAVSPLVLLGRNWYFGVDGTIHLPRSYESMPHLIWVSRP